MIVGIIELIVVAIALLVAVWGDAILIRISLIKQVMDAGSNLLGSKLDVARFGDSKPTINYLAVKPLADILQKNGNKFAMNYRYWTFAKVIDFSFLREKRVESLITELRRYCTALVFLYGAKAVITAVDLNAAITEENPIDFLAVIAEMGKHPTDALGTLELAMIAIVGLRLSVELIELNDFRLRPKNDESAT